MPLQIFHQISHRMHTCILHLMTSVTGSGLDNSFLFCKLLLEENSTAEESITSSVIVALQCSEQFNAWKANFVVNHSGLPKIENLIKM